jgi:purine-nucleoside phosphorylase
MNDPELHAAATRIRRELDEPPEVFIVLGSGLGEIAEAVENPIRLPFTDIQGLPDSTVRGHAGRFVAGRLEGRPVLVQCGRYHYYEGHPYEVVVAPVRIARRLGIESFIVTNAAGGIREDLRPGRIVAISDHLNLHAGSPLRGPVRDGEARFPDMTEAYDAGLRAHAARVASDMEIDLTEGVYASLPGPAYETPAEIRMLRILGADTVGMSTVPSVTVARNLGMRVLGFSLVTNSAAGLGDGVIHHEEVMQEGRRGGRVLGELIRGILRRWDEVPGASPGAAGEAQSGETA